jgi:hypothetical protein
MRKTMMLILTAIILAVCMSAVQADVNPSLARVYLIDKSDILNLAGLHLDIAYVDDDYADIVAYPEDISQLKAGGFHYEIIHEDLVAFYQSRYPLTTTMGGFLTFSEILDTIDALHANYPNLVSARDSIGASWEGRALWVFKISDNVQIDEDEPEVFYNSLIHAREPESWAWQLNYITWLLTNYGTDDEATEIINNRELYFLPVVNPDGYEYNRQTNPNGGGMWRKNRRSGGGVDLNRNWGYMWGYDNSGSSPYPSDETYRGPSGFSEPETQAARDFIISRDFKFILNGHTYGNWFLYPYSYNGSYTPDHNIFVAIGDSAAALTGYTPGTCWETLGYYANGEATDWQYGDQGILSVVVETGSSKDGFWPPAYRIPQINAQLLPLGKYISLMASNLNTIAPPAAPVLSPIGEVDTCTYTVSWTHDDVENPAVAFELVEKSGLSRIPDDLESGSDLWQLNGFALRTNRYHSDSHSLFSGSQSSYHGDAVMNDPISVVAGDTLTFFTWYSIEDGWDYAYVELSTDGGVTYSNIPGNITTNSNPHSQNHGNGITGSSDNQWIEAKFPLDDYIGMAVMVKLAYITDGAVNEEGIYFDDIYPLESFDNEIVLASDITENSYLIDYRENGTYFYQVRAVDAQDQWSGFSNREEAIVNTQVGITDEVSVPFEFNLSQNYPNPFNARTEISFSLAAPGEVKLEIFDISGRLVKTLVNNRLEKGHHVIVWDGLNDQNEGVSTGIYFYKLSTGERSISKQMTLLK